MMRKWGRAWAVAVVAVFLLAIQGFARGAEPLALDLEDGEYAVEVRLAGGSGRTFVSSPAALMVRDGKAYAKIQWNSPDFQEMAMGEETFFSESGKGENAVFTIPVTDMDREIPVTVTTSALGYSHEIEYALTFYSDSVGSQSQLPQEAAKRVVMVAGAIILIGGILNYFVKKSREA